MAKGKPVKSVSVAKSSKKKPRPAPVSASVTEVTPLWWSSFALRALQGTEALQVKQPFFSQRIVARRASSVVQIVWMRIGGKLVSYSPKLFSVEGPGGPPMTSRGS